MLQQYCREAANLNGDRSFSHESMVFNNVPLFCVPTANTEFERTAINKTYEQYPLLNSIK